MQDCTFANEIDAMLKHNAPLVVSAGHLHQTERRYIVDGVPIYLLRLATDVEFETAMRAVAQELPLVSIIPAPYRYLFRLDTLLGQLEHEQPAEQPRELEQPAAVPTLLEMAEHQAAYDAAIATDPTRWPVSQEEAAALFARITARLKELDPLARELARTDPDGEWMTSDYIWRRMMAQGDE